MIILYHQFILMKQRSLTLITIVLFTFRVLAQQASPLVSANLSKGSINGNSFTQVVTMSGIRQKDATTWFDQVKGEELIH